MRNARSQTKYPVNRPATPGSIGANSIPPMKNTLLISTALIGLAIAGCNKSTPTSTAANDPTYPNSTSTTSDQAAADSRAASGSMAADTSATTGAMTADAHTANNSMATDTRAATGSMAADARNAANKASDSVRSGANSASNAMANVTGNVAHTARLTEWRLNSADIQADIDANREIVRTKTVVGAPTGNMDKSTVQAAVEGRIKADTDLSTFKIEVDPGRNGEVNLDGEVNSADQVGKAIALALDTDGVTKVTSKIEVSKNAKADRR